MCSMLSNDLELLATLNGHKKLLQVVVPVFPPFSYARQCILLLMQLFYDVQGYGFRRCVSALVPLQVSVTLSLRELPV